MLKNPVYIFILNSSKIYFTLERSYILWIFIFEIFTRFKDYVQFVELSLYNHWIKASRIPQQENLLKARKCKLRLNDEYNYFYSIWKSKITQSWELKLTLGELWKIINFGQYSYKKCYRNRPNVQPSFENTWQTFRKLL